MTQKNKRILGVGIIMTLVGLFKIYTKGIYSENNEINWFNLLVPFGMGVLTLIYLVVLIVQEKKN